MEGRGGTRRIGAIALVLVLVTATLVALPDVAAAGKVRARGTALCNAVGRVQFSPKLGRTPRPGTVMRIKATLGCLGGATGVPGVTVRSGRLSGVSTPFTASCLSLGVGAVDSTVRWRAEGGSVERTTIRFSAASASPTALTFDLQGTGTGSYAGQVLRTRVVGDPGAGGLCSTGAKRFAFSGARGASLVTVGAPSESVLFEDRFDGTALDTRKWRPNWLAGNDTAVTKAVNAREQSCYDPRQVSVGGGVLRLRAAARPCVANNGTLYPYASGLVETAHDFTFTFGRAEARIWLPPGSGPIRNWPAFWANGTGAHPTTGEIDVVEGLDGEACWHFHSPIGRQGDCAPGGNPAGWHTYAADWRPGSITYFYDGVPVGRITTGVTSAPMYLVLNLGVSSLVSPPVALPSEMLVDYVRVTR
jgi:hypothetical protein